MRRVYNFLLIIILLHCSFAAIGQKKDNADSLVRLIQANSVQLQEVGGVTYRKVIGPATFLHNNTYLVCDTALWNVNENYIDALGHVQVMQENTFLRGDKIEYVINENLAKFRGALVELFDKDGNVLRTNYLDYNTKDSIATFYAGGALKNNDGNLIESENGIYQSKEKLFTFENKVQMFTDSVFIISTKVDYRTDLNKAYFGTSTTAWKDENMLFANSGIFDRVNDVFEFDKDGYILTQEQEVWSDLLKYYRLTGNADLSNNFQMTDTVQQVIFMSDKAVYKPSPMKVTLSDNPVAALYTFENNVADTLFLRSDSMSYFLKRYCDIDSAYIAAATERVELSNIDPIAKLDAELKAEKDKIQADRARRMGPPQKALKDKKESEIAITGYQEDPMPGAKDSLLALQQDSIGMQNVVQLDTSKVAFIDAFHNVKFYRSDVQGLCDSLVYSGVDSMARFYTLPVMWNDVKNQFSADSMQAVIKNRTLSKVNMLSNAFIIAKEDSLHFNQIKSTEMAAFFYDNKVYRFDALGGASAILYVEEDSIITIMNQKECKMLTSRIKDNKIQRTRYINELKQDAYPVFNLPIENQRLRGFQWRGDERPQSRNEITQRTVKPSWREKVSGTQFPNYTYTATYFPAIRDSIFMYKKYVDSLYCAKQLAKISQKNNSINPDSLMPYSAAQDSLRLGKDSLELRKDSIAIVGDTLAIAGDSLKIGQDSLNAAKTALSKREIKRLERERKKELRKKEKALRRQERALRKKEKALRRQERALRKKGKALEKDNLKNSPKH